MAHGNNFQRNFLGLKIVIMNRPVWQYLKLEESLLQEINAN